MTEHMFSHKEWQEWGDVRVGLSPDPMAEPVLSGAFHNDVRSFA